MRFLRVVFLFIFSINLCGFSTTNIQYLYGSFDDTTSFDTQNGGKSTITLEHYSTNSIGDLYGFADFAIADDRFKNTDKKHDFYFEIAPRISLSKISSKDLSVGIFKDWYLSAQYNRQIHKYKDYYAYMYGAGTNVELPGFDVFGINLYKKDKNLGKDTYQATLNYKSKDIFVTRFIFSGFIDITEFDMLTNNQFSYDMGSYDALVGGNLYIGTEWLYFKVKHTDIVANTLQLLIKVVW